MTRTLSHVAAAVFGRPWFITPEYLRTIGSIVEFHLAGGRLTDDELGDRLAVAAAANGPRAGGRQAGAVAVIPVYGMIAPRATLMTEMSGGTTIESLRRNFRAALADETVGSILLDIDSPGGIVDGVEEMAAEIRAARGTKPIVAIADYCMASAAYYLGSQADEVVATPSALVGWVGTALVHMEYSKQEQMEGVTATVIRNPPGKLGANAHEPLSDQARAELQQQVDDYTAQFHAAVAKGRGVSVATVKAEFGEGGGMTAARAKAAGLVDRVETFDDTVRRMSAGRVGSRGSATALAEGGGTPVLRTRHGLVAAGVEPDALPDPDPMQGGEGSPADDPDVDASGEAGAPPAEALDELALERAIAARRASRGRRD